MSFRTDEIPHRTDAAEFFEIPYRALKVKTAWPLIAIGLEPKKKVLARLCIQVHEFI